MCSGSRKGSRLGSVAGCYHRLGPKAFQVTFQAPWLYEARPEALLTGVHGCWFYSLPKWAYRMGSAAAWVLWQNFLVRWNWKLYSAVGL